MAKDLHQLLIDRNNIKTLVLCVGTFDNLHWGHLKYLQEAKKLGTVVVSVSSDRFIKKGINRPIFNESQRLEMVSNLECVDYVVLNDAPNASELIKLIRPNIMVKGNEYKNKNTPQLATEQVAMGDVEGTIRYLDTQYASSSNIINRCMSNLPDQTNKYLEEFRKKYSFQEIQDEIIKSHKNKITIVGETILDEYISGTVLGKSSKHPSLVFKFDQSNIYLGGIIAIARHLSTFVDTVEVISYLGEHEEYKEFIQGQLGSNTNIVYRTINKTNSPTILKRRYIDSYYNSRLFETYHINQELLSKQNEQELINLLPNSGDIIVADFGHGLITPAIIEQFYARYTHICTNVQCNSGNFGFNLLSKYYEGVYFASVDTLELQVLMGDRTSHADKLVKQIFDKNWSPMYLTVTKGKAGSTLYNSFDNNKYDCPAMGTKVIDSIGSGDCLYAISSLLMLNKCPLDIVNFVGSVAGSLGCSIVGNARGITRDELLENIEVLLK